jgi:L-ascorbate metabolism protein UlaG (beta-lactamase superfamily)
MLIQIDGVNILTDPMWSERASVVSWVGPKRIRAPGVDIKSLPRIDLILISHNHYDHLDLATLRQLSESHKPTIIVGLGVEQVLALNGFGSVAALDWWQAYDALPNGLKIVFVPARHGSGRGLFDRDKTLWGGFVITSAAGDIYFAGYTGYGDFFGDIRERFAPLRLTILPIGHYEPRWMMEPVHMTPDDAVRAHVLLKSRQSVGMHFGTFHGAGGHNNETFDQHETDLRAALEQHAVPASEFRLLGFGEGKDLP